MFALKAQDVRVDLATAVARSATPKCQLAAQLGWTSDRLEKALTGSGDLSRPTIFAIAITRALGLDFEVVIATPDATSATDGKTKTELPPFDD